MNTETILHRIKKLLALADMARNPSPEEAATAAAKVEELLFAHKLSMADVTGLADVPPPEAVEHATYTVDAHRNDWAWKSILLNGVGSTHFCKIVRQEAGTTRCSIFGAPSDVQVALYLFEYLMRTIEKMATTERIARGVLSGKAAWERQFALGATMTVIRRLKEHHQAQAATATGTALVVVSARALAAAVAKVYPSLQKGRSSYRRRAGFAEGQAAGQTIGLRDGLTRSSGVKALTH